ncbi:MAG: Ig-like domain-containing protein [Gemmatimonadetes bacterium]|nr:Ig-like domain-containing protein [Gemmatimonadota bacterium]
MRHVVLCATLVAGLAGCSFTDDGGNTPAGLGPQTSLVTAVTMGINAAQLAVGGTVQLQATPRTTTGAGTSAKSIMLWSSSAPAVASVTQNGLVTGLTPGTANIIANADGHTGQTAITVTAASTSR